MSENKLDLAKFADWMLQAAFEACDVDGSDIQEQAIKFGLVTETQYDPDKHGPSEYDCEPGDPYYVYSDSLKALLAGGSHP
jgi:hypothetical protein